MGVKIFVAVLLLTTTIVFDSRAQAQTTPSDSNAKSGCRNRCGDVLVPYPFGVTEECALSDNFVVACNDSGAFLTANNQLKLQKIDLEGTVRLQWGFMSYICDGSSVVTFPGINLNTTQYTLSYTENTFFAAGNNNTARIVDDRGRFFGCTSSSSNGRDSTSAADEPCTGLNGCCQISIPRWLTGFSKDNVKLENNTQRSNQCSSIVMAQNGNFTPAQVDDIFSGRTDGQRLFPIVWDWAVEKITCEKARNGSKPTCNDPNSECVGSNDGVGYLCKCKDGYRGNPYLPDGCKDIDECKEGNPCPEDKTCKNTEGSHSCTPDGLPTYAKILIVVGIALLVLLLVATWIYWVVQKRRFAKRRETFFHENGGLLLQQHVSNNQENAFKIFSAAELEKATNKYSNDTILGRGGFGMVYKGTLDGGREIAIKKSIMVDEGKSKEFAKEMLILSQINHVNVVKLMGCCLEVEVPMLVYEYIPYGTLHDCIHHMRHDRPVGWSVRLKLAAESAKALAYLHEEASPTILHGDIKSPNILLGENYTAKVSDFGTSTLAPKDKSKFVTVVQGTWGYLDPEYLQTGQLTEKSDVYSFGVVLAELLTGRKAVFKGGDGVDMTLAFEFNTFVKTNRLLQILDEQIVGDEQSLRQIEAVARIVVRCLSMVSEERPTMTHISMELEMLRRSVEHRHLEMQDMEKMHYQADLKSNYSHPTTSEYTTETQRLNDLHGGR